jgi:hypothetical protein
VSQISPPIRILLVLTVAVLGVYMLFLRPKPEEAPPLEPSTTTTSEPVQVESAETAAGTATTQETAPEPAAAAAGKAKDLRGLPKPVRRAIRDDKVLAVLFWNEKAADDRSVRKSLRKVNTWDDRVFVHAAPLRKISRYGRIARGVSVEQSPTIVIADRDLKAETLVGYVDRTTIDQAVVDALRNSNGLFTDTYLRSVDKVCVEYGNKVAAVPYYYANGGVGKFDGRLTRVKAAFLQLGADFKAVQAPKRWAAFRSATIADIAAFNGHVARYAGAVTPNSTAAGVLAAERSFRAAAGPVTKRINKRFDAQGLLRCGSQF